MMLRVFIATPDILTSTAAQKNPPLEREVGLLHGGGARSTAFLNAARLQLRKRLVKGAHPALPSLQAGARAPNQRQDLEDFGVTTCPLHRLV